MASQPLRIFFSAGEPSGDLHAANLIRQLRARLSGTSPPIPAQEHWQSQWHPASIPDPQSPILLPTQWHPRELEAVGYGGPQMAAAGCRLHADLTQLAVMWLARAIVNLPKFWDLASRADRYFRHHRPDAVVLVDYPGFNWWIARRAKVHGIPVFYYTPPQIWAWATWRVKKMRRLADHVLCSLPFEEAWFRQHGCNATFVGHPFFDEVRQQRLDAEFLAREGRRPGPLVTILPGSRTQEVSHNFRWLLKAAAAVHGAVPGARFAVAAFKPKHAEMARRWAAGTGQWDVRCGEEDSSRHRAPCLHGRCAVRPALAGLADGTPLASPDAFHTSGHTPCAMADGTRSVPATILAPPRPTLDIYTGRTPELMRLANCCMACSGSVSLELLYHAKPTVILYWVNRPAYALQGYFRKVKYITLVNLLSSGELYPADRSPYDPSQRGAQQVLFPEYLTCEDRSEQIAGHVIEWLTDPAKRAARVAELERLKAQVAHGGASSRAAEYIIRHLPQESDP